MHRPVPHSCHLPRLALAASLAVAGCGDDPLVPEADFSRPMVSAALVSNPVTAPPTGPGATATTVAYVSMQVGRVVGGQDVTILNRRTGARVAVTMEAGGFDPIPMEAVTGDTLEVDIQLRGSSEPVLLAMTVPEHRPPVVVRTEPPPRKRDVPLNATLLIVFSEPINPATLTDAALQLLIGTARVPGKLGLADTTGLSVAFVPDAALAPTTDYQLVVTEAITDLQSDPLESAVTSGFTTAGCGGTPNSQPVMTVSTSADCSQPDVVASAAEALDLVEPGGIIQFESDGPYPFVITTDIVVAKPVTFRSADAGSPVIEVRRAPEAAVMRGFHVRDVPSGTVRFSGLTFVTSAGAYAAVYAEATYDQVVVEGSTFMVADVAGVFAGASTVPGARVTVSNNAFSFLPNNTQGSEGFSWDFGALAVFGASGIYGTALIDIVGNQVTGPSGWAAFQFQGSATGRIENNTATECGRMGCINAYGPGAVVAGNVVSSAPGLGTRAGIRVRGDNVVVTGNVVDGGFAGGDPADSASYGYVRSGIEIGPGIGQTVEGNTISGAAQGLEGFSNAQPSARDNVVSTVRVAFAGSLWSAAITNNDVTGYVTPFTLTFGPGALTCNWWGSAAGPQNVPAGADPAIYTPWATAPLARGAGGQCDGS